MKKTSTVLFCAVMILSFIFSTSVFAQQIFTEDFESGTANAGWETYYASEDGILAVPMAQAPQVLTNGGNFTGWLQDADASYSGSAVAINGSTSLSNYSIEADVYCYVNNSDGSAYTGLVVYADSSKHDFYKLRADFDASNRINFSGLRSDTITYLPLFSKDFKGVDNPGLFPTTDGWHKMKVEVRATSENETSFWCYFDGTLLTGCPIVDTTSTRNTSGSFGLYTFQMDADGIPGYFDNIVVEQLPTEIFSEDFESGTANAGWETYYASEDGILAVPMAQAPQVLTNGGNFTGWLQDADASYSGSAVAINGSTSLSNYSIEADVYCYVNNSDGSAYTGLVVYADSSKHDFYKLRADFDASNRINFSGLRSDTITYLPLFSKDFKGVDNPGLFPTTDGWHKMKVEVRATSENETSFWCYFDGTLLTGCPIVDTTSTRNTSGSFGLYTFQMDADGIPGYFDNIVVEQIQPVTSVEDYIKHSVPLNFSLNQNYPNPFNPSTNISYQLSTNGFVSLIVYDLLGRQIKTLVSGDQQSGYYNVNWTGLDEFGNHVPSGVYLYSLRTSNIVESRKMVLMK